MDCNSPDFYVEESAGTSAAETLAFVQEMLARASDRILPVVTPRFVPTCTSELMGKLGDIAKEYDIPIQSHLSESLAECEWVKVRFGRNSFDMTFFILFFRIVRSCEMRECCATTSCVATRGVCCLPLVPPLPRSSCSVWC